MLKSWYPIASSALTLGYYHKLYKDALSRTPVTNPTPILGLSFLPPTFDENGNYQPLSNKELGSFEKFIPNNGFIGWD